MKTKILCISFGFVFIRKAIRKMNLDYFLTNLKNLIQYQLKLLRENEDFSFYGDIKHAYETETQDDFKIYKKEYIDYLNTKIKIKTFDIKLYDVEFGVDGLKESELRFKYMLDIAKLFEGYDENLLFSFYTMLKVKAEFNQYNSPFVICMSLVSDLDLALINRADSVLLNKAADELGQELTFIALTAS